MTSRLANKTICMFIDNLYEDLEVHYPLIRLQEEGAKVVLVGGQPAGTEYKGKHGYPVKSDKSVDEVSSSDFDALIVPGGFAPDYTRRNQKMLQITRELHQAGKPVAAICHGPWVLISAKILKGVKATAFIAIKDDVENAGATWVDEAVVVDKNIITSRTPKDLTPFCQAIIKALTE
eukprot:TRINITY_DN14725_c0_g1_i1.p1 TRINITY_DN14725_c0_g1~~TRINITY_DN14725_c0_g1_i1.p1  ORF type:complete len:177 (-),score=45.28 TRINITY_DN14725_c0_g1_i1:36-566(-)